MSDYTEIFREFANSDTFVISPSLLEEYKQKAADAERERIIKLLEADKADRQPHCSMQGCKECPIYEDGFNDAIALIKGENK